jgi:hypothetical protein
MGPKATEAPEDCEHAEREVAELEKLLREAKERLQQWKAAGQQGPSGASLQQEWGLKTQNPGPSCEQPPFSVVSGQANRL